jgi:hypothetical protein
MNNTNSDNYQNNTTHAMTDNKIDSNNDKIVYVDKKEKTIYREQDDDRNITTINSDTNPNPFSVAMDIWPGYTKVWTDTYKQLFLRNPSMTNSEFCFIYWRSDINPKE